MNISQQQGSLSIVMPAYNEEGVIEKVVRSVCIQILEKFENPEFVIVNDCSTDATLSILKKLENEYPYMKILTNTRNQGHGPSLMRACTAAIGEYVFYLDSDDQMPVKDFWLLWEKMQREQLDVVTGVRKKRKDPGYRLLISKILQLFNKMLFGVNIRDINCPFKLYRKSALQRILKIVPSDTLIPSILILLSAHQLGLKVGEVEVIHFPRRTGKSFIRDWKILNLCWKSLVELFRFKKDYEEQ